MNSSDLIESYNHQPSKSFPSPPNYSSDKYSNLLDIHQILNTNI